MRYALLLVCTLLGGRSRADEVDGLGGKVLEIESRIRQLESRVRVPAQAGPELAERRLIDAQVLYELKNYEAASIVLLDIVQRFAKSASYPEALYLLADSLYLKHDFLSARNYFEQLVKEIGPGKRYQESLQRLIELSLYTGDYSRVDGYLAKLTELPPHQLLPSVPYVKGKYLYFRQRYNDALAAFASVAPDHTYWAHSQYFIGAALVAQGKSADAVQVFETLLKSEAKTASQRQIAELAHLALARIHYDQGKPREAEAHYVAIPQDSDRYADSMYEQAWLAIKEKQYTRAFRALDLMLLSRPEDAQVPEVKLLVGNLHIRESNWEEATESFNGTRDQFEPIYKELLAIRDQKGDLLKAFQELVAKNLGKFDRSKYLPVQAGKWVKSDPEVDRLVGVANDVGDLRRSLDEAGEIMGRVEKALSGPQKINVFPEFAGARARALEASNQLADIKRALIAKEHAIEAPQAGADGAQLVQLAAERQKLEKELADMPRSADSYEERVRKARAKFQDLDRRASEVNVMVHNFEAELAAIEKYFHDSKQDQKQGVEGFAQELASARAEREQLQKEYEQLRREIDETTQSIGIDDAQVQQEEALKKQLAEVLEREHTLGSAVRTRLQGADRDKLEQIESILSRVAAGEQALATFGSQLVEMVDGQLGSIRETLAGERTNLEEYRKALGSNEGETIAVGGGITAKNFQEAIDRFYQVIVRADVGIIDVAWALKQTKTDEDARLVREEKRELKMLDDEFREVLKE